MSVEITLSKKALKALKKFPKKVSISIMEHIHKLPDGDVKPLKGTEGIQRLRIGKYRVLYQPVPSGYHVLDIGSRGDIYKKG